MKRFLILAMLGALGPAFIGSEARAEDVSAKKILIKDNADTTKRQIQVQSGDEDIQFSELGNPSTDGAWVHVYSDTDDFCLEVPSGAEWQTKNSSWKYKGETTKNQVQVTDGKLKVKIKSGISFSLADDSPQGAVNVQIQIGSAGTRYCLRCATPAKDDAGQFSAKECVAAVCDAEPSLCGPTPPTTLPPTGCGNGTIESGEECEADTDCTSGDICTDACACVDPQCPDALEWTAQAGTGTSSEIDMGVSGLFHDADPADAGQLVLSLENFAGAAPNCGVADIGGVNPRAGNCRCANDTRTTCNEPFVADDDDCGGATCNCYAETPQPFVGGGTAFCVLRRLSSDVTGTWNVDSGSGTLTIPERTSVYLGDTTADPCPTCVGDTVPNDGMRNGTCANGASESLSCDANATDESFPAPGGGSYSYDCLPSPVSNIGGAGLDTTHVATTGSASLPLPQLPCDFGSDLCSCRVCSDDESVACSNNGDCSAASAGTCTAGGTDLRPNRCFDGTCTADGNGEGLCLAGPDDSYCDGVVRANGKGIISCASNSDCSFIDAGDCTLSESRRCFLDSISGTGSASTSSPKLASAFCAAASSNVAINSALGLPGPVKLKHDGATALPCAGNPAMSYPACP